MKIALNEKVKNLTIKELYLTLQMITYVGILKNKDFVIKKDGYFHTVSDNTIRKLRKKLDNLGIMEIKIKTQYIENAVNHYRRLGTSYYFENATEVFDIPEIDYKYIMGILEYYGVTISAYNLKKYGSPEKVVAEKFNELETKDLSGSYVGKLKLSIDDYKNECEHYRIEC